MPIPSGFFDFLPFLPFLPALTIQRPVALMRAIVRPDDAADQAQRRIYEHLAKICLGNAQVND